VEIEDGTHSTPRVSFSQFPTEWRRIAAALIRGIGLINRSELVHANGTLAGFHGYEPPDELIRTGWHTRHRAGERERIEPDVLARVRDRTRRR
jgi:hypothetical protein